MRRRSQRRVKTQQWWNMPSCPPSSVAAAAAEADLLALNRTWREKQRHPRSSEMHTYSALMMQHDDCVSKPAVVVVVVAAHWPMTLGYWGVNDVDREEKIVVIVVVAAADSNNDNGGGDGDGERGNKDDGENADEAGNGGFPASTRKNSPPAVSPSHRH